MSAPLDIPPSAHEHGPGPERLKAYTDAVVAIAQTLLILPLLESVPEAKAHHLTTAQWINENADSLIWFVMSFTLIWSFWITHHRVFEYVQQVTQRLQALNMGWMMGIVFFPVATALMGVGHADATQLSLYIGSLLFCSLMMNLMTWFIAHDPHIHGDLSRPPASSLAASFASTLLYLVALLLALMIPGLDYLALFVMFLVPVSARLLTPRLKQWGLGA